MYFKQLYDKKLSQYAYLIGCQATGEAVVIDPLRDVDQYFELAEKENLNITAAADTHIHADYVSGLREMADKGVKVYASDEGGPDWRYEWLKNSSYQFEMMNDGDTFAIGNIQFEVVQTPGHTPESVSLLVTDGAATERPMGILTGDFVFVGDVGRPDLLETAAGQKGAMKPAARNLYRSLEKFRKLPDDLQVWPAHGSGSACGKSLGAIPQSTVGYELDTSPAFRAADKEGFVNFILEGQPEPPLYFGRMKKVNREGPPLLQGLPKAKKLGAEELPKREGVIVDTRGALAYMNGHIPGSILVTLDNNFSTIAGSYIDPQNDIYLLVEEKHLEEAVRDLLRVGLDRIRGYAVPEDLEGRTDLTESIGTVDFSDVVEGLDRDNRLVLDVRKATEYEEGHLPGAIHIAHTRLADHLEELPRDKELMVHCASGQRASYATGLLAKNGFRVRWIDDRFENWKKKESLAAEIA